MGNLIKPADYAARMGISRQAVYAKIKKGILTSRNIGGKIFVVLDDKATPTETATTSQKKTQNKQPADSDGQEKLLAAKDETISILRETITDLKETNKMITSTLRGEVELLKEAFSEMKMLYSLQLEHKTETPQEQTVEAEDEEMIDIQAQEPAEVAEEEVLENDPVEWMELSDFYALHKIKKSKKQKKIEKLLKKKLKKGDPRIDRFNGELVFLAGGDFEDILKKV